LVTSGNRFSSELFTSERLERGVNDQTVLIAHHIISTTIDHLHLKLIKVTTLQGGGVNNELGLALEHVAQ
jgi:hypothetical protein